jgi:hypothetical protein
VLPAAAAVAAWLGMGVLLTDCCRRGPFDGCCADQYHQQPLCSLQVFTCYLMHLSDDESQLDVLGFLTICLRRSVSYVL